ncbi:hypothetical protein pEaSNUABM37_00291 [Erwinia phage pEa_SNUABM_37]|nr:hypothetical protein pEaSNUABM37_00291 [Erwinia phage pEa_SNUABM_37]QXO10759.1 hypothetical protein pEaSNUABM48_00291 [Erwinia phage pEa_SNUABM_48]
MSDVVIVSKQLLERLLETVECNDPRNEYLNAVRSEIAKNEHLRETADDVMHKFHMESGSASYHELDRKNKKWLIMGEFGLDPLKVMVMYLANPPADNQGMLVPWDNLKDFNDD